jgi:alpha-beta hydrolase superfamily lysophospholipase
MFTTLLRHLAWFIAYALLGVSAAVVFFYSMRLDSLPDLSVWHTARLESEFRESSAASVRSIEDYRALETRLFTELKNKVIDKVERQDQRSFNRYVAGSMSDPFAQAINWNATFELSAPNPRGSVLMIHGLTDSPYVMRALGERLNKRGYHVVGLRLPGHGTAPSGLLDVHWRDFAAAVRMAARDLAQKSGNKPLYMVGFSTGAALSVEYALARAQGEDLPAVSRMVLMSPAIGVSPAAALAVWQKRVGNLLGIEKLAWNDVEPEYDPYKYNSFAVNAAEQVYEITRAIAKRQAAWSGSAPKDFPPILTFQSVADGTVSAPAVIKALFGALTPGKHGLVLFDINRYANVTDLYQRNTPEHKQQLLKGPSLPFELTMLANKDNQSTQLMAIRRDSVSGAITEQALDLSWPASIFSLSHVALPISPDDPVYGSQRPQSKGRIYLGAPQIVGESGLLAVPAASLMRLRYNPFFDYMAERIERFLDAQ